MIIVQDLCLRLRLEARILNHFYPFHPFSHSDLYRSGGSPIAEPAEEPLATHGGHGRGAGRHRNLWFPGWRLFQSQKTRQIFQHPKEDEL